MPLINPEITPVGAEIGDDWEGCLSDPRHPRPGAALRAGESPGARPRGAAVELELADLSARVVQHETDHLDGVLFFDRMKVFESLTFLEEYRKFWRDVDDARRC